MATIEETRESLERIQMFEPGQLARREELGKSFHFQDAVVPTQRVVELFSQISSQSLSDITPQQRDNVKSQADQFWDVLNAILSFDPGRDNALAERNALLDQVKSWHDTVINNLHYVVSYIAAQQRDYSALERELKAAVERVNLDADKLRDQLLAAETEAQRVLSQVRATAAELGVSQQAIHFGNEAAEHEKAAAQWQRYTTLTASGLGAFAVASLFVGKSFLIPNTPYEAFQLGISKVLIFATIAFMLFLCARTLIAHRHNRVVNKHRHNALLTFNALVDAAEVSDARDVVLTHASGCIFAPQETGFTKGQSAPQTLVELMPKFASAGGQGVG